VCKALRQHAESDASHNLIARAAEISGRGEVSVRKPVFLCRAGIPCKGKIPTSAQKVENLISENSLVNHEILFPLLFVVRAAAHACATKPKTLQRGKWGSWWNSDISHAGQRYIIMTLGQPNFTVRDTSSHIG
jgi:hypothetical protein